MHQILHRVDGLYMYTHFTAIMALDHSRLGLENKILESKSGRIFFRLTRLLYKIVQTNLGACKPTFGFLYITSEVKQYYETPGDETLFLSYRPRTQCSISQFWNINYTHSIETFGADSAEFDWRRRKTRKNPKSKTLLTMQVACHVSETAVNENVSLFCLLL